MILFGVTPEVVRGGAFLFKVALLEAREQSNSGLLGGVSRDRARSVLAHSLIQIIANCKIDMRAFPIVVLLAACFLLQASAVDVSEPVYTEDVEVYRKDNPRGRMELLLGCWLLSREYNSSAGEDHQLALIKACMRTITRKDSVVKITSLIGKNMTLPKTYQEVVSQQRIPSGAEEGEKSELDKLLLEYVRGYAKDIDKIERGKEGEDLKKKVEEEIAKRQKYYFGIIPANQFTHTIMLVVIAILMVAVCTCWKYYSRKSQKKEEQGEGYFSHHNHTHGDERASFTKSPKPKRS